MVKKLDRLLERLPNFSWNARTNYFTALYAIAAGDAFQSFQNKDLNETTFAGIISMASLGLAYYAYRKDNENERKYRRKIRK